MNPKSIILLFVLFTTITSVIAEGTLVGTANMKVNTLGFLGSAEGKISTLFPLVLLLVCIVSFAIDFGTTGVILASLGTLVFGYLMGFIAINPVNLISFCIMGGILIFSLKN